MAELLSTFAAPSPAERTIISERILQIAEEGSRLDNEIERVEKILASLRHNRAALYKLSDGHQNVLNLTRRLPIEILGEIFIKLQSMLGGRSIAPTQVCRQWREVAIATSELWNRLNIQYNNSRALADAEMIPIWLQRSGGQPLHIVVWGHRIPYGDTRKQNPVLDSVLHNEARRWKEIKLVARENMIPFINNIPEYLPMLYSLNIDLRYTEITTLNNFRHAAALRVLTLSGCIIQKMPEFPWTQLTACTLHDGSYTCAEVYFVLSQAVNLQVYKIDVDTTSDFSATLPPISIHHVNLISLEIEVTADANPRDLLNLLTLPALIELKLQVLEFRADYTPESITSLITRSGCSLMQLALGTHEDSPFTSDQLLILFSASPRLTELELRDGAAAGLDEALMDLLTHCPKYDVGPCCLLPQLVSIKLSVYESFRYYGEFTALLKSRYNGWACRRAAKLCTAVLMAWNDGCVYGRLAHHLPEMTYSNFIALRDSGLDLYVDYRGDGSRCSLEACPIDVGAYFSRPEEKHGWDADEGDGFVYDDDDDDDDYDDDD